MPKPSPEKRAPRTGEQLSHSCHACKEYIAGDELRMWTDEHDDVWFVHGKHVPEDTDAVNIP